MKEKNKWFGHTALVVGGAWVALALLGRVLYVPAQSNPAPPAAAAEAPTSKPSADPTAKIPLTPEESKDLEFNQLQIENLDFKVEQLRNQIMSAKQKLAKETADLTAKFAKAHNVDLTKYRLDPQAKVFVPLPVPAPAA